MVNGAVEACVASASWAEAGREHAHQSKMEIAAQNDGAIPDVRFLALPAFSRMRFIGHLEVFEKICQPRTACEPIRYSAGRRILVRALPVPQNGHRQWRPAGERQDRASHRPDPDGKGYHDPPENHLKTQSRPSN